MLRIIIILIKRDFEYALITIKKVGSRATVAFRDIITIFYNETKMLILRCEQKRLVI